MNDFIWERLFSTMGYPFSVFGFIAWLFWRSSSECRCSKVISFVGFPWASISFEPTSETRSSFKFKSCPPFYLPGFRGWVLLLDLCCLSWMKLREGYLLTEPLPDYTIFILILAYLRRFIGLLSCGELLLALRIFYKLVWLKKFIF